MEWSPHAVELAKQLFDDGKTDAVIAAEISARFDAEVSVKSIRPLLARKHAEAVAQRIRENAERWLGLRNDVLTAARDGIPPFRIAEQLDVSLGFVYSALKSDGARAILAFHFSSPEEWLARIQAKRVVVPDDPIVAHGRTFLEKEATDCCWPIGRRVDGEQMFCLGAKHGRSSYCAEHHQQSIRPESST